MVNTRVQASQNNQSREDEMNDFDDNSSKLSPPEFGTRTFEIKNNAHSYGEQERDHERVRIERSFSEMNRQNGELTSLVRTLTERISSTNREENGNNSPRCRSTSHSDMVAGVIGHTIPKPQLDPPRRTLIWQITKCISRTSL